MTAKLDVKAASLALGILWSVAVLFVGLMSMLCGWGVKFVELFASFYIGYDSTVIGSLIGAVWGFIDGAIGGFVVAWLYNKLAK